MTEPAEIRFCWIWNYGFYI